MSDKKSAQDRVQEEQHHDHCAHDCASHSHSPIRYDTPKVGRNEACPCQSGKKYKKCCLKP